MTIYEDSARHIEVERQLFENKLYFIDFEGAESDVVLSELKSSRLNSFVDWHIGNQYATLKIGNFIGNIFFFGHTYDVKSQKFLTDLSGSEQFQVLLDEVQELSKNMIFTYSSPSFVMREVDYSDIHPTLLLIFNYFKQIILDWDKTHNLESSLVHILNNPNFKYQHTYKVDKTERLKKIDTKTLRNLVSESRNYVKLDDSQEHLLNLPITKFISQNSQDNYFPTKALMKKKYFSNDTPENRFVKFFFEYIESIAYQLNNISGLPVKVLEEKEKVLSFCQRTLRQPFFHELGSMNYIPTNSTVLQSRAGYKDIFLHFTRSRFGIKHIFDDFIQESMSVDLKRISDLYEYWVFYKIAVGFLGNDILIEQQDVTMKDGEISYGVCFRNDNTAVYYNWTESRARNSAYSVLLRPDTTVVVEHNDSILKFIFDAKYKIVEKSTEENIQRHIKPEDIYKMHTYLDAIQNTIFAVAIYPGTEFYFYEKT